MLRLVTPPHDLESVSHVVASDSPVSVLTELLRQVPVLTSECPEAILELVSKLDEFHDLGLVDDRVFVIRVLPKVSGAVLRFFGECLRSRDDWENCKTKLLIIIIIIIIIFIQLQMGCHPVAVL